jgi:hypothetical protein
MASSAIGRPPGSQPGKTGSTPVLAACGSSEAGAHVGLPNRRRGFDPRDPLEGMGAADAACRTAEARDSSSGRPGVAARPAWWSPLPDPCFGCSANGRPPALTRMIEVRNLGTQLYAPVAQQVEASGPNPESAGSNPAGGTMPS